MTLSAGLIVPHPPIIIPEIGGDRLADVEKTVSSMRQIAEDVAAISPDIMVAISPHSSIAYDAFLIKMNASLEGTFSLFGHSDIGFKLETAMDLAEDIRDRCQNEGIPVISHKERAFFVDDYLDHGVLVPYYFLSQKKTYRIVSVSISGLSSELHYAFGKAIGDVSTSDNRKIVFMASGDLSHRLTYEAPAGYSPRGAEFDSIVREIVEKGELEALMKLDDRLVDAAGECGLRSFITLAGVLDGKKYNVRLLSYEGPFGVGYLVAMVLLP